MIEWLRSEWHPGMSLDAIIELRWMRCCNEFDPSDASAFRL
jgi:hypothetical protein